VNRLKHVIVIMGTPGVGKTSIASSLASRIHAKNMNLGILAKTKGYILGNDPERDSLIVDTKRLSEHLKEVVRGLDGDVVIEEHYAHEVVPKNLIKIAFVLRRNPIILEKILTERGFNRRKVLENVAAEILDVCLFDAIKTYGKKLVCEIDVAEKSVEEVVNELMEVLENRKSCSVGIVDWIRDLEQAGKIEDYLSWL